MSRNPSPFPQSAYEAAERAEEFKRAREGFFNMKTLDADLGALIRSINDRAEREYLGRGNRTITRYRF